MKSGDVHGWKLECGFGILRPDSFKIPHPSKLITFDYYMGGLVECILSAELGNVHIQNSPSQLISSRYIYLKYNKDSLLNKL